MQDKLIEAKDILISRHLSCVILVEGKPPVYSEAMGIKPLMQELQKDRQAFDSGVIADKVVGKAAALLAVFGGAKAVYGTVMSQAAAEVFGQYHIQYEYDTFVSFIENRNHTGKCPMEAAVWTIDEPAEAFDALKACIAKLMADSPFKK